MSFHKIQKAAPNWSAWALVVGIALQVPPALGGDPFDPVPAHYCTQGDALFWYFQISDTHIGAGSQDDAYLYWAVTEAKSVINPSFIVLTGDITDSTNCDAGECGLFGWPDGPHIEEWAQYRDVLCLECPDPYVGADDFFDLLGNHDVYSDGNASYYLANSVQGRATGNAQVSWTREYAFGKYHFLGLNTSGNDGRSFSIFHPYGDNAGLDASELAFLEGELLTHADAEMTILFGHHPMDETGVSGDTWIFYGADDLATLMNGYGVSAYGYGHTHRYTEEFFSGGVDDETGNPYDIDPIDPERGVFYFNVNSLGKEPGQHIQLTAIDCNGISTITRDAYDWPMVMITAPVDIDLGITDNPFYLDYVVTDAPNNPIRALAFDVGAVSSVQYRVDGVGEWQSLTHVNGPLWEGAWDASGLSAGVHSLQVQATGSAIDTDTINVYIQASTNLPPVASFTYSCTDLDCSFDASASTDTDGTIAGYSWNFGDGNSGSGVAPSHEYAVGGTYSVALTVTDNDGATDAAGQDVIVEAPPNQPPVTQFDYGCSDLTCSFDGVASYDPDGDITSYSWDFGDGNSGSGVAPSHDYAIGGTYGVTLTVTDNDGATGVSTQFVTVEAPANQPPVASFTYSCTDLDCSFNASASTDTDGTIAGYSWNFGDGGTGPGATPSHTYSSSGTYTVQLTVTDDDGATGVSTQGVTVSESVSLIVHIGDLDGSSAPMPRGRWEATVEVRVHDTEEGGVPGAAVTGVWSDGASGEAECTTDVTGKCSVSKGNLKGNVASVTFTVSTVVLASATYDSGSNHDPDGDSDDGTTIVVYQSGAPTNQPPVAQFNSSCPDLTCSFDGSGSTDSDGSILSYEWSFGDGNTGSGVNPSHTYAAAGTYTVQLTVMDDDGASDSTSDSVSVGQPEDGTLHVGDLVGDSEAAPRSRWTARVTILVHDEGHASVADATVTGTWSGGTKGGVSCVTGGNGECSVEKTNLKISSGEVIFTVDSVTHATLAYDPAANDEQDGATISLLPPP